MKKDTVCRLCSSCCPVEVVVEDNRLIAAVRKSSPPSGERSSCPKLMAVADIVYSPDRLKKPLVRAKRDQNGFSEASWNNALNLVADRFQHFKKAYGAESVCWLRGWLQTGARRGIMSIDS